jgi:hypothetical protein
MKKNLTHIQSVSEIENGSGLAEDVNSLKQMKAG